MKLLLLSLWLGCLPGKLKKQSNVLFIPNAGDPYDDPYFVKEDYKRLVKLGYNVKELDIKNELKTYSQLLSDDVDAIFIAGGNVFYLLYLIQSTGFDKTITQWIENDKLYIGASAGAVIMGPSLEPVQTLDDPRKAPNLKSYNSLNLINLTILPHYGKEKYLQKYNSIIEEYSSKFEIKTLKDDEALYFTSPKSYSVIKSDLILHDWI